MRQRVEERLAKLLWLRSSRANDEGMTLVELLVSLMLFAIIMAMTVPIVITLGGVFANTNRNLTAQDQQILVSNQLDTILQGATAAPGSGSASALSQAVFLVCPDAMIFYTNAALPGEHSPSQYGGWVYIYLSEDDVLPNGLASYTLNVENVGSYSATQPDVSPWPLSSGGQFSWSSDCGPSQGELTSQIVSASGGSPILSIDDVIAPQPSVAGFYYLEFSGPFSGFYEITPGGAAWSEEASTVGEVSYDIEVKHLACGNHCTAQDVSSTPSVTLRSMVTLPNVLLANGEGSGLF